MNQQWNQPMKCFLTRVFIVASALIAVSSVSPAMGLDEFLTQVASQHKGVQAYRQAMDAAQARAVSGTPDLATQLIAKASSIDDQYPQVFGTYSLNRTQAKEYSLGFSKKFITGTQASIAGVVRDGTVSFTNSGTASEQASSLGSYNLALSQSLWKDFFGQSTRSRVERSETSALLEKSSYDLQLRQLLIEAEAAFWDYIYLKEELQLRKDSLDRAKRIEGWVKQRASNGIGDRGDVLNASGLVASRELLLLNSEDEMRSMEKRLSDLLELPDQKLPKIEGDISQLRSPEKLSGAKDKTNLVRLDSYLSILDAKVKSLNAEEVVDSVRPDLLLEGSYKTANFDTTLTGATNNMFNSGNPTSVIALKFVWMIDGDVKQGIRDAAKKDALSAQLKKERKLLESKTAWSEMLRRHAEMTRKVEATVVLSQLQTQKAAVERDKLAKGRTLTSQVIQAEQDAAEAALSLAKLRAEQRKLESQGRMYVQIGDGI